MECKLEVVLKYIVDNEHQLKDDSLSEVVSG